MAFFNEILDINSFVKSPVRTLSLGQRMRADIAAALLHNPKVLFLDEPTIGLDVVAKQKMRDAIRHMRQTFGTTVILTTHDLDDIEELCDRIIMIDAGRIMYEGSLDEIKDVYGYMKTVKFECAEDVAVPDLSALQMPAADLSATADYRTLSIAFNKHRIAVSDITDFVLKRYRVLDMSVLEPPIETLVANIYEKGVKSA